MSDDVPDNDTRRTPLPEPGWMVNHVWRSLSLDQSTLAAAVDPSTPPRASRRSLASIYRNISTSRNKKKLPISVR